MGIIDVGIVAYCTHNPVDAQVHQVYTADDSNGQNDSNVSKDVYVMILRGNMDYSTVTLVDHPRACRSTPGHRLVDDRFDLFVTTDTEAHPERVPLENGQWIIVPHRSYRLLMRGTDRVVMRLDAERPTRRHRIFIDA